MDITFSLTRRIEDNHDTIIEGVGREDFLKCVDEVDKDIYYLYYVTEWDDEGNIIEQLSLDEWVDIEIQ